jgi:hypothetical protein
MAFFDTTWYANAGDQSTTGYYAVTKWATGATIAAGALRRQTAPVVGNERVFVCIVAGTTHATTEPTWIITRGAKTPADNTVTWQECTGASAVNGDLTNTISWATFKATGQNASQGIIIKRNNGASYQIASTITTGTPGASEPAFSDTAGATTTDNGITWTSLGVVGNFTGGQAPHARLANACVATWFAAGNTIFVGDNHAESQTTTISPNPSLSGTTVSRIICHNHAGSYPPASSDLATTATISTTAAQNITLNLTGGAIYVYGLAFIVGVGQSTNCAINFALNVAFCLFEACVFKIATTSNTTLSNVGLSTNFPGFMVWSNCQVSFAAASQVISPGTAGNSVRFTWQNTAQVLATGSSVPTNLFGQPAAGTFGELVLETLDLSQWTSVFAMANNSLGNWIVKDCKLNAAATFPTPFVTGNVIQVIRSDGGATAYKSARYAYEGTETTETSITRVGGASDPTGQAQSRKIVTTANSQWLRPFKAEQYAIWNTRTAANVTVTVYGTINAGAVPNNDDIWMEVEYLGSSSFPTGTIVNTTKANLYSANAAVASDGSTWNGGGSGAGWSPFKLTTTLSSPQPGMAGYVMARVRAAKTSTTWYIDPQIVLS